MLFLVLVGYGDFIVWGLVDDCLLAVVVLFGCSWTYVCDGTCLLILFGCCLLTCTFLVSCLLVWFGVLCASGAVGLRFSFCVLV